MLCQARSKSAILKGYIFELIFIWHESFFKYFLEEKHTVEDNIQAIFLELKQNAILLLINSTSGEYLN